MPRATATPPTVATANGRNTPSRWIFGRSRKRAATWVRRLRQMPVSNRCPVSPQQAPYSERTSISAPPERRGNRYRCWRSTPRPRARCCGTAPGSLTIRCQHSCPTSDCQHSRLESQLPARRCRSACGSTPLWRGTTRPRGPGSARPPVITRCTNWESWILQAGGR